MAKIDTLIYELGIDEKDFERAIKKVPFTFAEAIFRSQQFKHENYLPVPELSGKGYCFQGGCAGAGLFQTRQAV